MNPDLLQPILVSSVIIEKSIIVTMCVAVGIAPGLDFPNLVLSSPLLITLRCVSGLVIVFLGTVLIVELTVRRKPGASHYSIPLLSSGHPHSSTPSGDKMSLNIILDIVGKTCS